MAVLYHRYLSDLTPITPTLLIYSPTNKINQPQVFFPMLLSLVDAALLQVPCVQTVKI